MFAALFKSTEHGLLRCYFKIGSEILEEIGELFSLTRETAGITLKEVSEDLNIAEAILENIEDGKSGAFRDVFVLKDYIFNYAKYLGLDADKIIDEFNDYIFETTSKIPVKEIEKEIQESKKNEEEEKIFSPYTKKEKPIKNWLYFLIYSVIILIVIVAVVWSVVQITVNNQTASNISSSK